MILTPDQDDIFNGFCKGRDRFSMLEGYAGTGKTTLTTEIVKHEKERGRVTMAAPTHKAVAVMRRMALQTGIGESVHFTTVHSMLNLKPKYDEEGNETFEQSSYKFDSSLDETDVLVIDETSMIGNAPLNPRQPGSPGLFDLLMKELNRRRHIRVLFVGDGFQIPPVNEDHSPLFSNQVRLEHQIRHFALKEVLRQALDSPILRYATELRQGEHVPVPEELVLTRTDAPDAMQRMERLIQDTYRAEDYRANPDFMKIIAYRNNTVNYFNTVCRQVVFDQRELPTFLPGEMILVDKPYTLPGSEDEVLTTNTELQVKEVRDGTDTFDIRLGNHFERRTFQVLRLVVEELDPLAVCKKCHSVVVLHPDHQLLHQQTLESQKKAIFHLPQAQRKDAWKGYFDLRDRFLRFKYNYCITAHKSQGSTYANALVMDWDIQTNRNVWERRRINYVAVTRPKSNLYVVC